MTDAVHASPRDIRKLAASLALFKKDVAQAGVKVRGALNSANWHDQRKAQFEQRYRDLQAQIDRFMTGEVDAMIKSLNQLAVKLEDIRSTRL